MWTDQPPKPSPTGTTGWPKAIASDLRTPTERSRVTFRYADRTETVGPGKTVFVPAGTPHTYTAGEKARYLIVLTPGLSALIAALQSDHDPAHQREIYRRFDSEVLE